MRKHFPISLAFGLIVAVMLAAAAFAQGTSVVAEAVGTANLRAGIGTDFDIVGEISSGTRYPVVGRSEFYPWLLLGDPETLIPIGWVFTDLVDVTGDLSVVPLSTQTVSNQPAPAVTPTLEGVTITGDGVTFTGGTVVIEGWEVQDFGSLASTPSATPAFGVYAVVQGEINLRYGPGSDYARLGGAVADDRLEIVGYHLTLPWVQVRYESAPNGVAWLSRDLVEIVGDYTSTRPITQTDFSAQPTLTLTPAVQQQSSIPRDGTPVPVSPAFASLGNQMWDNVLRAGFDPTTSKFAAMYLLNLETGEEITFGNRYAFSGTSINKVAILAGLFHAMTGVLDYQTAVDIGHTMICSDNSATNNLLSRIGGGDLYVGAERVSQMLGQLGLRRTFITAPYVIPNIELPQPTSPIRYPQSDADQVKAQPDTTNQMTVDEMGYLLASIYQCGYQETGPLLTKFDTFTPQECRKMLHVMASNTVDAFAKAGTPNGTVVAHKHGWTFETHGNAAVVFSPGGDYVLVMMMYQPDWLVFSESLPMVAETSQLMYNYLNPETQLAEIREGFIPAVEDCNYVGSQLADELVSPIFMETPPPEAF